MHISQIQMLYVLSVWIYKFIVIAMTNWSILVPVLYRCFLFVRANIFEDLLTNARNGIEIFS